MIPKLWQTYFPNLKKKPSDSHPHAAKTLEM